MAEHRNNPHTQKNAGSNVGNEGGQNQQAPGRNPNEDQSTGERGGQEGQGGQTKDQGLGKGQQGNRDLNEGGFEKGGQGGEQRRQ